MLFDQATNAQIEAARIFAGTAMVAFLGARMFKGQAHRVRVLVTVLYIAGVLGWIGYVLVR